MANHKAARPDTRQVIIKSLLWDVIERQKFTAFVIVAALPRLVVRGLYDNHYRTKATTTSLLLKINEYMNSVSMSAHHCLLPYITFYGRDTRKIAIKSQSQ